MRVGRRARRALRARFGVEPDLLGQLCDLRLERRTGSEPWVAIAQTKPPSDDDKKKDARNAKR